MSELISHTNKELKYLNLDGDIEHLFSERNESHFKLPMDFSVYIVAKWSREVVWGERKLTPEDYAEYAFNIDGYHRPVPEPLPNKKS